ncbi:hypothetical protein B4589_009710 [Halolamina sp. CBA1230]|uniref:hypothetical protein n=1 Tax=Halolamina sp. CBA1230 TaxID=1853690 RepID=UPI0009A19144|nr:hypothetical protein [Halolamina sp. CBA1230]QKY20640.1 hypothetical protein B4589_009710 [Halolamina sp. CBA1230]
MNRAAVVAVALAVLVGSVPAAATLSSAQATPADGPEPGAAFAGVVGVQEAEIDSEIAQRSLTRQLAAAASNGSKARIVAQQQQRLAERIEELEAEKTRLKQAYENGSIGQAQYQAQLAGLSAQIRAVERRADQTATAAASLPEPTLREHGANVSQVRSILQQANRTGGGEVAEAARAIAGEVIGGLGSLNASKHAPIDGGLFDDGNETDDGDGGLFDDGNETDDGGLLDDGNETDDGDLFDDGNETDDGDDDGLLDDGNETDDGGLLDDGTETDDGNETDDGGLLGDRTETLTPSARTR